MMANCINLNNYFEYQSGRTQASNDAKLNDFDLLAAIASFDSDPADSPYQCGYLRDLREAA